MARVKTARTTRARHKKVLKRAKGYYGAKHYRFRMANQAVMKSGMYAYVGRKDKKSNFRKLWIIRINAAARMNGLTYSTLIAGLKKANVTINRKMLAELAIDSPKAFTDLVDIAKDALTGKEYKPAKVALEKKTTKKVEAKEEKAPAKKAEPKKEVAKKAPAKKAEPKKAAAKPAAKKAPAKKAATTKKVTK